MSARCSPLHISLKRAEVLRALAVKLTTPVHGGRTLFLITSDGLRISIFRHTDNLSGVLFLPNGDRPPKEKDEHESGSRYVLVEKLAKDVYFFETR